MDGDLPMTIKVTSTSETFSANLIEDALNVSLVDVTLIVMSKSPSIPSPRAACRPSRPLASAARAVGTPAFVATRPSPESCLNDRGEPQPRVGARSLECAATNGR